MIKEKLSALEFNTVINLLASNATPEAKCKLFEKYSVDAYEETTGKTLLLAACEKTIQANLRPQYKAAIRILLDQGADPNKTDNEDKSPLWFVAHGDLEITQCLVEKGANVNHISKRLVNAYTPLLAAAGNNQAEIINYLLQNGAQPDLRGGQSQVAPLYDAAHAGFVPAIRALLRGKANVNVLTARQETPLLVAVAMLHLPAVRILLEEGKADANLADTENCTPLAKLIHQAKDYPEKIDTIIEILKLLHKHGADISRSILNGQAPIALAIESGQAKLCEVLLALGVNPRQLALMVNDSGDTVPTRSHWTPLALAASRGNLQIVKRLLETAAKADINVSDHIKRTPLYLAVINKHTKVVVELLKAGADPNLADINGTTPLNAVCEMVNRDILLVLIKHDKIDLNKADKDRATPLHKAVKMNFYEGVRLLLANDAFVNPCADDGATPVLIAAQEGFAEILKLLIEKGGDPEIYRKDGSSPLFMAYRYGQNKECLKLLLENFYKKFLPGKNLIEYEVLEQIVNGDQQTVLNFIVKLEDSVAVPIVSQGFFKPAASPLPAAASSLTSAAAVPSFASESAARLSQSGYAFLRDHGFTRENILAMRQKNATQQALTVAAPVDAGLPPEKITWFNGLINAAMPGVNTIERGESLNCFLYLDRLSLQEQGCDLAAFTKVPLQFCAAKGEQGIKRLQGEVIDCKIIINEKENTFRMLDEIKILQSRARILCFRVISDDGRYTLLVGIRYGEKGLHKTKDRYSIFTSQQAKPLTLHMPDTTQQLPRPSLLSILKK